MKLGTHNGNFHADEVFATAFLLKLYPEAEIIRSRDLDVLSTCDIVFDVGHGKYDHHARDKEYRENGLPYAASGLIWRDFGREILQLGTIKDSSLIEQMFLEIDEKFVQPIDAQDNGVSIEKSLPILDIAGVIRTINPTWDAKESEDELFHQAVNFAQFVFLRYLDKIMAEYRAFPIVEKAYEDRAIPELVILNENCPWEQTIHRLDKQEQILYVIRPGNKGQYTVQAVPKEIGDFPVRKKFPDPWGGLEGEELVQATGVDDAVFCHSGLWMAVSRTQDGATRLAKLAIEA